MDKSKPCEKNQGKIRILSHSPYECLDPDSQKWLNQIKTIWPRCKNGESTIRLLNEFYFASRNPYISALQAMITSGDFYTGKKNSLAYSVMECFSQWTQRNPESYRFLNKGLKYDAFELVMQQKNQSLMSLVLETYKMKEDKEIFIDLIRQMLASYKYKLVCQCAVMLELYKPFKVEDFIIPLIFQDKYSVVEKFLEGSKEHQLSLLTFLDDLMGKKNFKMETEVILRRMKIPGINWSRLHSKPLGKLMSRMIKTFDLPSTACPNLMKKRGRGALQFLFNKRFLEKSIGGDSWAEMALEAVGDDESLQLELIDGVAIHGDLKEALSLAETFDIPEDKWPGVLKVFKRSLQDNTSSSHQNTEGENSNLLVTPQEQKMETAFHKLPIQESKIFLVDTEFSFRNFLNDMAKGVDIVGLDAEWKPCFGFKKCDLALLQIATYDSVYIIDVITLGSKFPTLWEIFSVCFLGNPNIVKLGFAPEGDLSIVKETISKYHGIKTNDAAILDLANLWKVLVREYNFVFPHPMKDSSSASESLNCLIEMCLGEKLDKSDQFSNWENRPLRKSQIIYAALDAYCLLEAYNVLLRESGSQSIPITDIVNQIIFEAKAAKKKKVKNSPEEKDKSGKLSSQDKIKRWDETKEYISGFRFICDSMLWELARELRKCGVDTLILNSGIDPKTKETSKTPFCILTQHKVSSDLEKLEDVYHLKSIHLRDQFQEVLNLLNVEVLEGGFSSRCLECNANRFDLISQQEMIRLRDHYRSVHKGLLYRGKGSPSNSSDFCDDDVYDCENDGDWCSTKWSSCQEPLDYVRTKTSSGIPIDFEGIPARILWKTQTFYVCVTCGQCFWENSHKGRGLRGFKGSIDIN